MRTTEELFGNVDRETWELQEKLAKKHIEFAKIHLTELLSVPFEDADNYLVKDVCKAITFWETKRNEAIESLGGKRQSCRGYRKKA